MIDAALALLRDELLSFIRLKGDTANVILDNIALLEATKGDTLDDSVILSLVNIEEESTLKNQSALRKPFANSAVYENPPVYLNLYILFACNYFGHDLTKGNNYQNALKRLSYIIQFLQSRNSFSTSTSVSASAGKANLNDNDILNLRFTLELYTLTFEQINHLWGSLGGKQIPFAMYKLRLVAISERAKMREVPLIEEVNTLASPITTIK
jgi:hypothetical protein